jgi:hypothetical protein
VLECAAATVDATADPDGGRWSAGNQIRALTRFGDPGLLARFGFPRTLPRD